MTPEQLREIAAGDREEAKVLERLRDSMMDDFDAEIEAHYASARELERQADELENE